MGMVDTERIDEYLRSILLSQLNSVLGQEFKSVLDLPASFEDVSMKVRSKLNGDFAGIGISLHDFYVNSVSVPEEVQKMIDTRSGLSAVGNMDEFMKYKVAMAIGDSANNPAGNMGGMMGMGAGMGMGFMMPSFMQQAMMPAMGGAFNGGMQQPQAVPQQAQAAPATAQAEAPLSQEGVMDKLKKLKELMDMGILTQTEFDDKKKKLLEML